LEGEEPILHDLDSIVAWTKALGVPVDCKNALAAWNLFGDVARSIHGKGIAFDRLDSKWPPDEIAALAEVLSAGCGLLESRTHGSPERSKLLR
jgi:hypothetical protein